jgi:hypothetical protein
MRRITCALVHHPVVDRQGAIVTSAITNIDLHDISRSSLTFGLDTMFVVHPVEAQRTLAERVRGHWVQGAGGKRIPDRKPALEIVRVVPSLHDAIAELGQGAEVWTTSAQPQQERALDLQGARSLLQQPGPAVMIIFGTGWGLAPEVHTLATHHLEPIRSPRADGYNHLSVRAAAAILFDRLLGV